ncbi:MAG: DUF3667 domain-containing protein [Rubrivivax sp.]|nr:MAG: DUF3667 domain-containing protein [Rubrivivax sp.]
MTPLPSVPASVPPSGHPPAPADATCHNCDLALQPGGHFCPHCGQEAHLHAASMREFIHEFVGHYVALEGPLWRTLWAMLFLPGRLTREYFIGRRRRYVQPLRLYLSLSFIFFIAVHLLPGDHGLKVTRDEQAIAQARQGSCSSPGSHCTDWQRRLDGVGERLASSSAVQVQKRLDKLAPYAMLLMQPVFAGLLALVFLRRRMKYAEHFVFALHLHACWFAAYLLAIVLPAAATGIVALVLLHGVIALRTVYGTSWWGGVWRGGVLTALYLPLLLVGMGALVFGAALIA